MTFLYFRQPPIHLTNPHPLPHLKWVWLMARSCHRLWHQPQIQGDSHLFPVLVLSKDLGWDHNLPVLLRQHLYDQLQHHQLQHHLLQHLLCRQLILPMFLVNFISPSLLKRICKFFAFTFAFETAGFIFNILSSNI